jgi:hypothetical protein
VGSKNQPSSRPSLRPLPPGQDLAPLLAGDTDVVGRVVQRVFLDHGAHVRVILEAIAEAQGADALDETLEERVVDLVVEQETAGGGAALAGGPERAPEHALEGEVHVGVRHHDLGVLAAHLEREPLVHAAAHLADGGAHAGGAGEGDHRDVRVLHHGVPDLAPAPVHQLTASGCTPASTRISTSSVAVWGTSWAGLNTTEFPADERREDLPRGDGHGEVERRDDAAHADGPAIGHGPLVAQLARNGVAEQAAAFRRGVVGRVDPFLHIAAGLRQDLAHLPGHGPGDLFLARRHEVADATKDIPALRGGHLAPGLEATLRRVDGPLHVVPARAREPAQHLVPARGVPVLDCTGP